MRTIDHLYINGAWQQPETVSTADLIDPTHEKLFATVAKGSRVDVDSAVAAARRAFASFSITTVEFRIDLIDSIMSEYEKRMDEFSSLIATEVGIPVANRAQVTGPLDHMRIAREILRTYPFESRIDQTIVRREPIGVCGLISPWNWPIQTGLIKLIYGLAAGCTIVAKPSLISAASGTLLAEVLDKAGVPAGVFNLVNGTGREVGDALTRHPDVDLISFTGSTRAGAQVGAAAADSIKRVSLELGGKSANLVLPDADLEAAARWNVQRCFFNAGQSCHAPSRMLVHEDQLESVIPHLKAEARSFTIGDPHDETTTMGPIVSEAQYSSIRHHIQTAIDEGAHLITGGLDRPAGHDHGYFISPTVFTGVTPQMTIAQEEVFGPVLAVLTYGDIDEAIEIANDSPYGLGGNVWGADEAQAYATASQLRAGRITYNGATTDSTSPMGGYKQSGIGRSMGRFGFDEYLETKSVYGFPQRAETLPTTFQ